uniref:Uncharacterized protein n=1 Tax=Trichuris muris TaxID=70415 RepID=A0A5S6PZD4_TRIMR
MGNLLAIVATHVGKRTKNDEQLIELCVCVHETKTVSNDATCLTPFLIKGLRKRSNDISPLPERFSAFVASFLKRIRRQLYRDMTNSRRRFKNTSAEFAKSKSAEKRENRHGKMFHEFSTFIAKAINEKNLLELLPRSPFQRWLEESVRHVRKLESEMKEFDNIPTLRILSP